MGDTQSKITIDVDGGPAKSALSDISSFISGVGEAAKKASDDSKSSFDGLWDTLKSKAGETGDALKQCFENPVEGVKALGGIVKDGLIETLGELGAAGELAAVGLGAVAAIGVGVGATLFGLADHAANAGEQIEAFSIKSGMAAENVGPLDLAAKAAGGSLDTLSTILRQVDMKGAADSGGKFTAALEDMGVNAEKFKNEDFGAQVADLSRGLETAGEKGNAMSDALAIGGRGMSNNIAFLEKLNPELLDVAKSMSMVWTPELLEQSRQFSTDLGLFEGAIGQVTTRIGAELLPVMSHLLDTFVKSPDTINGIVSAADVLGHGLGYLTIGMGGVAQIFVSAWDTIKTAVLAGMTVISAIVTTFADVIAGAAEMAAKIPGVGHAFDGIASSARGFAQSSAEATGSLASQTKEAATSIFTQSALATTVYQVGDGLLSLGQQTNTAADAHANLKNKIGDNTTAATAFDSAMDDLNTVGKDYHQTLLGIDGETVNAVEYYLAAGVSAGTLKTVYELSAVQIKALEQAYKDYEATLKEVRAVEDSKNANSLAELEKWGAAQTKENKTQMDDTTKSITQTEALWRQYYTIDGNAAKSATQLKVDEVNKWRLDEEAKLKASDLDYQNHYDAIEAVAKAKLTNIVQEHDQSFQDIKGLLKDLNEGPGGFADTFAQTLVKTGSVTDGFTALWKQAKTDLDKIAGDMLSSMINGFLDPLISNVKSVASSIGSMLISALTGGSESGGGFGGFVSGALGTSSSTTGSGGILGGALSSLFSSGSAFGAASAATGVAGATAAGLGVGIGGIATGGVGAGLASTTIGTGMIGEIGGTATAAGGSGILSTIGAFATNPITLGIAGAVAGIYGLYKLFSSGPSDTELAGRTAETNAAAQIWGNLSPAQQAEANKAGWSDPHQAGLMIGLRDLYTQEGHADAEAQAESHYNAITAAIPDGPNAVAARMTAAQTFDLGGIVQGPSGVAVPVIAHGGETFRTQAQETALTSGLVDQMTAMRDEMRAYHDTMRSMFRTLPGHLKHALR